MSANSLTSEQMFLRKFFASLAILALLFSSVPFKVFAQEADGGDAPSGESSGDGSD